MKFTGNTAGVQSEGRVHAAVGAIYDAAAQPEKWPQALAAIAFVFDAKGTVLIYNRDDGSRTAIVSPGLEAAVADYDRGWWKQDIGVQRGAERALLSQLGVYTDRDVATLEEIKTHPFYADFRARHGLGYYMGGSVSPHPKVLAVMGVQGRLGGDPYTDEDMELFALLGRHMERALRLSIRLFQAEVTNLALGEALSRLRSGVIVVNEKCQVLFRNAAAMELLGEDLLPSGQSAKPELLAANATLRAAIADAVSGSPPSSSQPILIGGARHERPLVAHVLPMRFETEYEEAFVGARALVLLVDLEPGAPADPSLVRDLLNLTLGEARVASLVGAGKTPREAASALGITEETTRTVLKRVYAKVGVSRQSELTAILARATLVGGS